MTTDRRFCRFNRSPTTSAFSMTEIPEDGLCISAFVLLSPPDRPGSVLMGHMDPRAPWDHIGGMDKERVETHRHGWMLPSSHLLYGESPLQAAHRIVKEQLELGTVPLGEPKVVSEVYAPRRFPNNPGHWDLEFLFRGTGPTAAPRAQAWAELRYVETASTPLGEFARSHEDVVRSAGFRLPA